MKKKLIGLIAAIVLLFGVSAILTACDPITNGIIHYSTSSTMGSNCRFADDHILEGKTGVTGHIYVSWIPPAGMTLPAAIGVSAPGGTEFVPVYKDSNNCYLYDYTVTSGGAQQAIWVSTNGTYEGISMATFNAVYGPTGDAFYHWPWGTPTVYAAADTTTSVANLNTVLSNLTSTDANQEDGYIIQLNDATVTSDFTINSINTTGWIKNILIRPATGHCQDVRFEGKLDIRASRVTVACVWAANPIISSGSGYNASYSNLARLVVPAEGLVELKSYAGDLHDVGVYEMVDEGPGHTGYAPNCQGRAARIHVGTLANTTIDNVSIVGSYLHGGYLNNNWASNGCSEKPHTDTIQFYSQTTNGMGDVLVKDNYIGPNSGSSVQDQGPYLDNIRHRYEHNYIDNCTALPAETGYTCDQFHSFNGGGNNVDLIGNVIVSGTNLFVIHNDLCVDPKTLRNANTVNGNTLEHVGAFYGGSADRCVGTPWTEPITWSGLTAAIIADPAGEPNGFNGGIDNTVDNTTFPTRPSVPNIPTIWLG